MSDFSRSEINLPSRRAVAKAAAWAAPTIALAVAAPAQATSPAVQPAGLQGWIAFQYVDNGRGRYTVRGYNSGTHMYGTYGLWITNTTPSSSITDIKIYLHYLPGPSGWSPRRSSSHWSDLTRLPTQTDIGGVLHDTYVMTYTGSVVPATNITKLENDMYFESSEVQSTGIASHFIDRYVTINGVVLAFRRGRGQADYKPLNDNTPGDIPPSLPIGRGARMAEEPSSLPAPDDASMSAS